MQTVLYEGLPIRPDGSIWWRIVERYKASVMFTSPTAIRVLKRQDPAYLEKHDTSSLERLYLAGEPLDEPTWEWISKALKITILDNYWQTETGWPILALLPKVEPPQIRPGSPGIALFGYDAKIVDPKSGEELPRDQKGILALGLPLPPGCMPTVWNNDDLFEKHYCGRFPGKLLYSTFDYAVQDEDGYFFILGRSDDVINVAGHRLGTREIEETVSSHPAVAEVATVGASDPVKGQAVHCFVVLKNADAFATPEDQASLKSEIESVVVQRLGAFSRPSAIYLVRALPKTRSGKIFAQGDSRRSRAPRHGRSQHIGRSIGAGCNQRSDHEHRTRRVTSRTFSAAVIGRRSTVNRLSFVRFRRAALQSTRPIFFEPRAKKTVDCGR
jgi:propionyl-CoA synthetase